MARAIHVASGSTGVQAATDSGALVGVSFTCAAAASCVLRDGTDNTGKPLAFVGLAAAGQTTVLLPAVEFGTGVFVDRSTASELVLYVEE